MANNDHSNQHDKRVKKNKFIIHLILICLTLEGPFRRFTRANKSICILITRVRFLLFAWLTIKFSAVILLHDCKHSLLRGLLYDWTVYYPVNRRGNLLRCFMPMYAYHLCIKFSAFIYPNKKPFDASLLDFLTQPPPLSTLTPNLSSASTIGINYLRDRRHWFELSEKLHKSFGRVIWWILPVCASIVLSSSVRLGYIHEIERECDKRMPLLRLVGLLEINFCLIECTMTFVGSFTYSLMVKHDLLLQADRVETYLVEIVTKYKASEEEIDDEDDELGDDDYLLFKARSSAESGGGGIGGYKQLPDINSWVSTSGLRRLMRHNKIETSPHLAATLENHGQFDNYNQHAGSLLFDNNKRRLSRYSLAQERLDAGKKSAHAGGNSAEAIREAQSRVTLYLKCIDSHKPAVSYLGGVLLIWLITSLSWVPVLFGNWNEPGASRASNTIYLASCVLTVSTSLVFTAICAGVYQRSITLTASIFRLCARHHGKSEAVRWNKILLIWFSPNRCALKIGNFLQLTYLNILKSISFLVSGLTFILNYMSN